MEEDRDYDRNLRHPSVSTSRVEVEEEEEEENNVREENEDSFRPEEEHNRRQQSSNSGVLFRINISIISNMARASGWRDDVWSCVIIVLTFWLFSKYINLIICSNYNGWRDDVWSCVIIVLTFWLFASTTMVLGFYGSVKLQLGPNCSRLLKTNPFFVQSIKVEGLDELKLRPVLYGFHKSPPLDVEISWTESHNSFIQVNFHKEWVYYLNQGSKVDISYNVKSKNSLPLSLVIARGKESLAEWIGDPSYPNTTLSWNIIYESGKIQQEILVPSNYYIAVGNLNSEQVEIELKFTVKAFVYDTRNAYHRCSLSNHLCSLQLFLLGTNVAVLTSPGPPEGTIDENWYVKLSYGPRWIIYFVGTGKLLTPYIDWIEYLDFLYKVLQLIRKAAAVFSPTAEAISYNNAKQTSVPPLGLTKTTNVNVGVLTALVLLGLLLCSMLQCSREQGTGGETGSSRAPLLSHNKDDDLSSWGSSNEYTSHDEEDPSKEGDKDENSRRLCAICWDAPRECFFLPCGHCAACFSCGTRIVEEPGTCPVCCRKIKKVRKIFTV